MQRMSSTSLLRRSAHISSVNTLSIHNVFHSVMLQSAVMNALSSQCMTDSQPSSQIVSDEEVWDKEDSEEEVHDKEKNSRRST
jgi:hypothetical protein